MNRQSDPSLGVIELSMPDKDWRLLNEVARELPEEFHLGNEPGALDWLEQRGDLISGELSDEIREPLMDLRDGTGAAVVLLTTKDPGEGIGPTPLDHLIPAENRLFLPDMIRGVLVGSLALHGYGYTSQQQGVIFNNMVVADSQRHVRSVASSTGALNFHTEDSAMAEGDEGGMSPDVLSLHYFRNDEEVSTPVSVPDIRNLRPDLVDELYKPQFYIPNSPAQGGDKYSSHRMVPALFGKADNPSIRFNAELMPQYPEIQGPHAMTVVEDFTRHITERAVELIMKPGDILFIDNRRALHAKGAHTWEAPPGQGRWQRRLALTKNMQRLAPYLTSHRIVDPNLYLEQIAS